MEGAKVEGAKLEGHSVEDRDTDTVKWHDHQPKTWKNIRGRVLVPGPPTEFNGCLVNRSDSIPRLSRLSHDLVMIHKELMPSTERWWTRSWEKVENGRCWMKQQRRWPETHLSPHLPGKRTPVGGAWTRCPTRPFASLGINYKATLLGFTTIILSYSRHLLIVILPFWEIITATHYPHIIWLCCWWTSRVEGTWFNGNDTY